MELIKRFDFCPIVFHFNKKSNEEPTLPMWILKLKGETHYVDHVDIDKGVGFSTKETPENSHTKGAIKIKGCLNLFKDDNGKINAKIMP